MKIFVHQVRDARKFYGEMSDSEKKAYRQGEKVGESVQSNGQGRDRNKYPYGSDEYRAWESGYNSVFQSYR